VNIKVKNANFMATSNFLSRINGEDHEIPFAFHVSTIINRVNAATKIIEELRKKIMDTEVKKDAEGNTIFFDDKKQYVQLTDKGGSDMDALMKLESDVDVEQFTMEELKAAGVKIKPAEVEFVRWLIK
jgi:predicted transcriptional regulator